MDKVDEMDLVILAGGRGSRISKYTKRVPKPLIKINNTHFIQYLINFYSKYNFKKIYILTGYKGYKFNKFNGKRCNLIPIECIKEKKKLDTGGAIYQLKNKIKNNFILVNGDSFIDYDVGKFIKRGLNLNYLVKILLVNNSNYKSNNKLSNLKLKKNGYLDIGGNLMNGGIYFLNKKIFNYLRLKKISLEEEILPKLIKKKLASGFYSNENLLDIGTYSNLKKAKNYFRKYTNKYSVFLDRDGVINIDKKYVYKIKDFIFRKNVISALKYLNQKKMNIFVVTNQAGIAKGFYTENDFFKLSIYMKKLLYKKNIFINDIEHCPFHHEGIIKKYKKRSKFRKPGNLLIEKLKKKWNVQSTKSYMIGDKVSDSNAAKKSGIYFEYVEKDISKQFKRINKKIKS